MEWFFELTESANQPWVIAILLFFGTYLLEDVAIVTGATLALDNSISPALAFLSLLGGIITGDLLLYAAGFYFGQSKWVKKITSSHRAGKIGRWLSDNLFLSILLVRFMPGLRLPSYLACGWLAVSLIRFIQAVLFAGLLWMSIVFLSFFLINPEWWQQASPWKWSVIPGGVLLLYIVQKGMKKISSHYLEYKDGR